MRVLTFCLFALLAVTGCGDDTVTPDYNADPITDLTVMLTSPYSVSLTWTAPTVESSLADSYEIRYRADTFADTDWDAATVVSDPPFPDLPDETQSCPAFSLPAGGTLIFRIRYEYNSWLSDLSNPATVELPEGTPVPDGFVYVPSGEFTIGSPADEPGRDDDEILYSPTLSRGLFVGQYEVTQIEYATHMGGYPGYFAGADNPVEQVDWFEAVAFCNARSNAEGLTPAYDIAGDEVSWDQDADGYRLLTEAEWEIACRARTEDPFYTGEIGVLGCVFDYALSLAGVYCNTDVDGDDGVYSDADGPDGPAAVGGRQANDWGLKDMHGNVYEWCWDWYRNRPCCTSVDPVGPAAGTSRVIRGGCWTSPVESCRSAARSYLAPTSSNFAVGFRIARQAE